MPRLRVPAMARAYAQHSAARRQQFQRSDGEADTAAWRETRLDAQRDAGVRRDRDHRGGHPRVHRVARRIREADHVVTITVGRDGHAPHERRIVRPEKETDLHDDRSVAGAVFRPTGFRVTTIATVSGRRPPGVHWSCRGV